MINVSYAGLISNTQADRCLCGEYKKKGYTFCRYCYRELSEEIKFSIVCLKVKTIKGIPEWYRTDFDIAIKQLQDLGRIKQ